MINPLEFFKVAGQVSEALRLLGEVQSKDIDKDGKFDLDELKGLAQELQAEFGKMYKIAAEMVVLAKGLLGE